jgi:hypothetical protein
MNNDNITSEKPDRDSSKTPSSSDWTESFLAVLKNTGNVRRSCEEAGVSRTTVYSRKRKDKNFSARWVEAMENAIDRLESMVLKQAEQGDKTQLRYLRKWLRDSVDGDKATAELSEPSGAPNAPYEFDFSKLTKDELDTLETLLRRALCSATASGEI